jgi:hypothetical protein
MAGLTFLVTGGGVNSSLPARIVQGIDTTLVVRESSLRNIGSRSIALEVDDGNNRSIDRQLLVVGTEAVTVSIRVREKTRLKDGVGRRLYVWNKMRRREGSLFVMRD